MCRGKLFSSVSYVPLTVPLSFTAGGKGCSNAALYSPPWLNIPRKGTVTQRHGAGGWLQAAATEGSTETALDRGPTGGGS